MRWSRGGLCPRRSARPRHGPGGFSGALRGAPRGCAGIALRLLDVPLASDERAAPLATRVLSQSRWPRHMAAFRAATCAAYASCTISESGCCAVRLGRCRCCHMVQPTLSSRGSMQTSFYSSIGLPRATRARRPSSSDSDQTRHEEMGVSGLTFNMCLARLAANAVIEPWLRLCAALVFVPPKRLFKVL